MSWGEGYREGVEEGYYRAIRAVVAAQWAVAIVAMASGDEVDCEECLDGMEMVMRSALADLPTAEQIVDGVA